MSSERDWHLPTRMVDRHVDVAYHWCRDEFCLSCWSAPENHEKISCIQSKTFLAVRFELHFFHFAQTLQSNLLRTTSCRLRSRRARRNEQCRWSTKRRHCTCEKPGECVTLYGFTHRTKKWGQRAPLMQYFGDGSFRMLDRASTHYTVKMFEM